MEVTLLRNQSPLSVFVTRVLEQQNTFPSSDSTKALFAAQYVDPALPVDYRFHIFVE